MPYFTRTILSYTFRNCKILRCTYTKNCVLVLHYTRPTRLARKVPRSRIQKPSVSLLSAHGWQQCRSCCKGFLSHSKVERVWSVSGSLFFWTGPNVIRFPSFDWEIEKVTQLCGCRTLLPLDSGKVMLPSNSLAFLLPFSTRKRKKRCLAMPRTSLHIVERHLGNLWEFRHSHEQFGIVPSFLMRRNASPKWMAWRTCSRCQKHQRLWMQNRVRTTTYKHTLHLRST